MSTGSNIDPIRAEIMRLEGLQVFDQAGWERVLADLRRQDSEFSIIDAERRMRSAMGRQELHVLTDLGMGGALIDVQLIPVKKSWGISPVEICADVLRKCNQAQEAVAVETEA